jgi:hypothetical protein
MGSLHLVIWMGLRISQVHLDTPFGIWVALVFEFNILSLVMDTLDVSLYLMGNKKRLSNSYCKRWLCLTGGLLASKLVGAVTIFQILYPSC